MVRHEFYSECNLAANDDNMKERLDLIPHSTYSSFLNVRKVFSRALHTVSTESLLGCNGVFYSLGGDVAKERLSHPRPHAQEL